MDSQYAIKDLELLSGVKAHTLRIWEQRYGILKPHRTDTNVRYYSSEDLKKILNVSLLNSNGYKISKIAQLENNEIINQAQLILDCYKNEYYQIDNLALCMIELNELKFEEIISNCIIHFGLENTMEKVIFPFLSKVGTMWQMGLINVVQEHFISNLIRQKLIVGIDSIKITQQLNAKTFVLFLPNKELHELGLLYCTYLIKTKGHNCIYLGQSVPIEDLEKVNEKIAVDYVITSFTNPISTKDLAKYLETISETFKKKKIIVSGRVFQSITEKFKIPSNINIIHSYQEFKNIL